MGQIFAGLSARRLPRQAPVVSVALEEDLRLLLLHSLPSSEAELERLGFERCVDNPEVPGHKYLEGYFHGYLHREVVDSIHPRLGCELRRRPAPAPLAAFCEAFRRANQAALADLEAELGRSPCAEPLAQVIRRGSHFCDLSVQVHWGDAVPTEHVGWHVDAGNSYLHMAIGLQGRRALHARRQLLRGRISQNCLLGPGDGREVLWQEVGSAYLGSPCCYPHAVEYPAVDWEHRIIAVQCRLHLTEEELFGTLSATRHEDMDPRGGTAAIVFKHTAAMRPVVPGLADVQAVLDEFSEADVLGQPGQRGPA